jgi:diacylglycerol kinase (ATP)
LETESVSRAQPSRPSSHDDGFSVSATSGDIAVFVNPHSRANRRNPRMGAEFQAILGDRGRVLSPKSLAELDDAAVALHASAPAIIALHGGDGTLHRVLTALGRAWGDEPLPPLAVLCGGTMNVVASSLGIRARPATFLKMIVEAERTGRPLPTLRRRCLRVGDNLGFVFGNGLLANFLGEYYATGSYGAGRAVWLLFRILCSAVVGGPFARRIFRRFEGTVRVDGIPLERGVLVGVAAATVREVGLGFKLNHRADDDLERFAVVAIHAPPLALVGDLKAVHAGRGIAPSRAFSAVASTLEIEPKAESGKATGQATGKEMSYTIDGDLYRMNGPWPLRITVGPAVTLLRPMPPKPAKALLGASSGDTMEAGR